MKFSLPTASANIIGCIERRKSDKRKLHANILMKPWWDLWNMLNASHTHAHVLVDELANATPVVARGRCNRVEIALEILTRSSFAMSADAMPELVMSAFRGNTRIERWEVVGSLLFARRCGWSHRQDVAEIRNSNQISNFNTVVNIEQTDGEASRQAIVRRTNWMGMMSCLTMRAKMK